MNGGDFAAMLGVYDGYVTECTHAGGGKQGNRYIWCPSCSDWFSRILRNRKRRKLIIVNDELCSDGRAEVKKCSRSSNAQEAHIYSRLKRINI